MTHFKTSLKKASFIIVYISLSLLSIEKGHSKQLKSFYSSHNTYDETLYKKGSTIFNLKKLNKITSDEKKTQKIVNEKYATKNVTDSINSNQSTLILNPVKKTIIELHKETLKDIIVSKNKANLFSCIITGPSNC